jgi:hypothetical protein
MKRFFIIAGSLLAALGCEPEDVVASPPPEAERAVLQMEQSAAALGNLARTLVDLELRQGAFAARMGTLFAELPQRHAALDAVATGIQELGPTQAAWGRQMEATLRASEPGWEGLTTADATRAALGKIPVMLAAPDADAGLRAKEARLLDDVGTALQALHQDVETFYDVLGELPAMTATADEEGARSLETAVRAYMSHLEAIAGELMQAGEVLRRLGELRYDLRLGVPAAWKERLRTMLSSFTAGEAGHTGDELRGLDVLAQAQAEVEAKPRQWKSRFRRLLGQQFAPYLALRHARAWHVLAREASQRVAQGEAPEHYKTHFQAVLDDSADEALRAVDEAQAVIDVRYDRHRRFRLQALERQVSRGDVAPVGRCGELLKVARADEGVAGEESFIEFMEGCR